MERPIDSEHRARLISMVELIAETSVEILRLREEIKLARKTLDRSQKRLSRREASVHLAAGQGNAL